MFTVTMARAPSHRVPKMHTTSRGATALFSRYEVRRNMLCQGPVGTPNLPHMPCCQHSGGKPRRPRRGRAVAVQQGHLASLRHSERGVRLVCFPVLAGWGGGGPHYYLKA